ncbi:MAG: methyltransferase [Bacillota bacterium]
MSEQYFTTRPSSREEVAEFSEEIRGIRLTLLTGGGVFSRNRIDFGTRLLLEYLELPETGPFLDLGCGYGPIAITVARLRPGVRVIGVEVNQRAAQLAMENAVRNQAANVEIRTGSGFAPVAGEQFSAIITNPPFRAGKALVHAWLEQAADHLAPEAALWVVVGNKQGAESLTGRMKQLYHEVGVVKCKGGFRVLRARRPLVPRTEGSG